jgi:exo-beta-1,3-glucanase (GH17 family)
MTLKMKTSFCIALYLALGTITGFAHADDRVRGVNYDPVHSFEFARAVGSDDLEGMKDAVKSDLDKIKELHKQGFDDIRALKTFFTVYTSLGYNHPMVQFNIADVVNEWNKDNPNDAVTLALGVYEFRVGPDSCRSAQECMDWTKPQVQGAIDAANAYPNLVRRIVVGNENLSNDAAGQALVQRMVNDIKSLRAGIQDKTIKIGTAQTSDGARQLVSGQGYGNLRAVVDFVGANFYPYWNGTAYGPAPFTASPAKESVKSYWASLSGYPNLPEVVMTEEGWPSAGQTQGNAVPTSDSAHDYLYFWYNRPTVEGFPVSYQFALFDKLPGQGTESHWGIYSADNYSSLLGTPTDPNNRKKPLSPDHVLINFENHVDKRRVAIVACTSDWMGGIDNPECFPIYGYTGTGDIGTNGVRQLMLDTKGKTYRSLIVVYYAPETNNAPRLCYVDGSTLASLPQVLASKPATHFELRWQNDAGNVPCGLSIPK